MKLYIWNIEYDVQLAIADNIKEARELIQSESKLNLIEIDRLNALCGDFIEKHRSTYGGVDTEVTLASHIWKQKKAFIGSSFDSEFEDADRLLHILTDEPDMVLDTNIKQATVYSHSNE